GLAEEINANVENNENEVSPQQSLESILQRPLPLFPLTAESEPQMILSEQDPTTGDESSNVALEFNNAHSSSVQNRASNDVDLSLSLGNEGAKRSDAIANNVAPGGMNGGTSTNVTLLPSKRTSGEFEYGGSSNMDEQVSLPKQRVTELHVSANNNVNPSPSPDLMQGHDVNPQNGAAPTPPQQVQHDYQNVIVQYCPLHDQASSQHNLLPLSMSAPNSTPSQVTVPSDTQTVADLVGNFPENRSYMDNDGVFVGRSRFTFSQTFNPAEPIQLITRYVDDNGRVRNARGIFYYPLRDQNGPSSASGPSQGSREILNYSAAATSSATRNNHNQITIPSSLRPHVRLPFQIDFHLPPNFQPKTLFLDNYLKSVVDYGNADCVYVSMIERKIQSILDHLRSGRSLLFQALQQAGIRNLFDASRPHIGLTVETIMQYITRENFVSAENVDLEDREKCIICMEEYEDGDEIGKLDLCVHKFHIQCVKEWLMNKNTCPICKRTALTMNNVVENEAGAEVNSENVNA
ncbi:putative E3 ubiquitin-protein ligase HIP1, partial [Mucuna pruriens]